MKTIIGIGAFIAFVVFAILVARRVENWPVDAPANIYDYMRTEH